MKVKNENFLVAYNNQSAVDYDTKLICVINITQNQQALMNYLQSQKEQYKLNKPLQNICVNTQYI